MLLLTAYAFQDGGEVRGGVEPVHPGSAEIMVTADPGKEAAGIAGRIQVLLAAGHQPGDIAAPQPGPPDGHAVASVIDRAWYLPFAGDGSMGSAPGVFRPDTTGCRTCDFQHFCPRAPASVTRGAPVACNGHASQVSRDSLTSR